MIGRAVLARLPGAQYLGVDLSPTVVEACQASAPEGADYAVGDLCDLPPGSQHIQSDLVLCLDVLFHLRSQERHDAAVNVVTRCTGQVAVIAAWNERIIERYQGHFAAHTAYRPLVLPHGMRCGSTHLPMAPEKTLHILTRRELGWEPRVGFADLVRRMVEHDLTLARRELVLREAGEPS